MRLRICVMPLLGLALFLSACGSDTASPTRPEDPLAGIPSPGPVFIVNGFIDEQDTYANVGAFIVQDPDDGQIFPICSGTLIAPDAFLTAGHCTQFYLDDLAPEGFTAHVSFDSPIGWGDATDLVSITLLDATQVITNPAFTFRSSDPGDLGVVILPTGSTAGITPASLPPSGLLDQLAAQNGLRGAVFTAVGYGVQDRVVGGGLPFFNDLNPIPRMFAFSSFNALNPAWLRLSQNPAKGDGGTCFGDSGGPNFLTHDSSQILAAITVKGDSVCRATNIVYRLDTTAAREFLGEFIALP